MNELAMKYDRITRLKNEYHHSFRAMCENALRENGLENKEVIISRTYGEMVRRYKGKVRVENSSSLEMPCFFEFASYEKDTDGLPLHQAVFYPTMPFFDVHEDRAELSDMNEYVKKYVLPNLK